MTSVFTPVERSSPSPESRSLSFVRVAEDFVPLARPLLGKGSLGSVRLVKDKQTGTLYAMKTIDKNEASDPVSLSYLKSEIKIQKSLQHPHITKLEFCCEDEQNLYLILSYAENGSLLQYLRNKRRPLSEEEAFGYFVQICNALQYLHMKNIIHRDLKPANILLDGRGNVKICDFGWSVLEHSKSNFKILAGTLDYMAPEILTGHKACLASDVWGLGATLFEMLHGYKIYGPKIDAGQRSKLVRTSEDIQTREDLSLSCQSLLRNMLCFDPVKRLTIEQVLESPWFRANSSRLSMSVSSVTQKNHEIICQEVRSTYSGSQTHFSLRTDTTTRQPGAGSASPQATGLSNLEILYAAHNSAAHHSKRSALEINRLQTEYLPGSFSSKMHKNLVLEEPAIENRESHDGSLWSGFKTVLASFGCSSSK